MWNGVQQNGHWFDQIQEGCAIDVPDALSSSYSTAWYLCIHLFMFAFIDVYNDETLGWEFWKLKKISIDLYWIGWNLSILGHS